MIPKLLGQLFVFRNDSFAEGGMVATTVRALAMERLNHLSHLRHLKMMPQD